MRLLALAAAVLASACSLLLNGEPSAGDPDAGVEPQLQLEWARVISGDVDDDGRALALDGDAVYVVGHVTDNVVFDDLQAPDTGITGEHGFVAAYTTEGTFINRRILETSTDSRILAVGVNASSVFVGGRFTGEIDFGDQSPVLAQANQTDGFLVRYSRAESGENSLTVEEKLLLTGAGQQRITSLSVTADLVLIGAVIRGETTDLNPAATLLVGDTTDDGFAAKLTSDTFSYRWSTARQSDTGNVSVFSVLEDPDRRRSYASGTAVGAFMPAGAGLDGFVAKVDPAGDPEWELGIPGDQSVGADDLALTSDGTLCTAGRVDLNLHWDGTYDKVGGADSYVGCVDKATNELRWVRMISGDGIADNEVVVGGATIVAVGHFEGELRVGDGDDALVAVSDGQRDIYVLELDTNGVPLRLTTFGGTGDVNVGDAVRKDDGTIIIVGSYRGELLFDGEPVGPAARGITSDVFVVSLQQESAP